MCLPTWSHFQLKIPGQDHTICVLLRHRYVHKNYFSRTGKFLREKNNLQKRLVLKRQLLCFHNFFLERIITFSSCRHISAAFLQDRPLGLTANSYSISKRTTIFLFSLHWHVPFTFFFDNDPETIKSVWLNNETRKYDESFIVLFIHLL